jgi:hypothetical protein
MIRNLFMSAVMAVGVASLAVPASAQVYVQVGPPAPVYEVVPARPGRGYVWVGGYYTWYGGGYHWHHGAYVLHGGAWCKGYWRHTPHRGYIWVNGRWC